MDTATSNTLAAEQVEEFQENGWTVVRNVIARDVALADRKSTRLNSSH